MNAASIAVVLVLFGLVGFALWRNFRKGTPCECGCSHKDCGCGCGDKCRTHGK